MHIVRQKWKSGNGRVYQTVLLRESYRDGDKVKKRTVANLSNCSESEVAAIELALKHKDDLTALKSMDEVQLKEDRPVGAISAIYQVAQRLGIEKALGTDFNGKLALWQVLARVLDQGSRLSAVRLAKTIPCELLGFTRGFDENDLYENLSWLSLQQDSIEKKLFQERCKKTTQAPTLFLYDVTSSYLEGQDNALADYGYNRDGKRGKKQIVMGLLCDSEGNPVSTELFKGNTQDLKTFGPQITKAMERFGCTEVTFVGDRGMIKAKQIEELHHAHFHYITAITKPQVEALVNKNVIQMELFEDTVCEAFDEGVRYIYRRNSYRVKEMAAMRQSKQETVLRLIAAKNAYLAERPKARLETALRAVNKKIQSLKVSKWLSVQGEGRELKLVEDREALAEESKFDGCYVIKTDLAEEQASKEVVHDRYKDLTLVERAFRTCKTSHLELRPVYVRTEANTRGHALVVMLAYMIIRELQRSWREVDLTVEECINQLQTLSAMVVSVAGGGQCYKIPEPRDQSKKLLELLGVRLPTAMPFKTIKVDTKKKLQKERKH